MTNAVKAQLIVLTNAVLAVVTNFGVALSDKQQGSITLAVNAALGLVVLLTYKNSPKRVAK